ncbi:MAG: glucose-1-phosphate cytidylyltransferase [Synechococcaceae cyanobacterium]|jgi:glucose-1-phosphate cytidylyltransferase
MQAVILAGGLGTRLTEETVIRPKPLVEIGGRPILWHIMKIYGHHNIHDFVICCGYKGYMVKEYFANYFLHTSDVTFDISSNQICVHQRHGEPWRVTVVDTGDHTNTGGRLARVADYIKGTFCFTYGDGVADLDISALVAEHRNLGRPATVTAVRPTGRFGALELDADAGRVEEFREKNEGQDSWVNGGFFVLEPAVLPLIQGDDCSWENDVLPELIRRGQLSAYRHGGFWQPMDTLREKLKLQQLWESGEAPWKIW